MPEDKAPTPEKESNKCLKEIQKILEKNGYQESNVGQIDIYWVLRNRYRALVELEKT